MFEQRPTLLFDRGEVLIKRATVWKDAYQTLIAKSIDPDTGLSVVISYKQTNFCCHWLTAARQPN
jgi:hypothetical protein